MELDTEIRYLKGVGEARAKALSKFGIHTVGDLLRCYPRDYEDWNKLTQIIDAPIGENVCLQATVIERVIETRIAGGRILIKTAVADDTGLLTLVFFNNRFIKDMLTEENEYLFFGRVTTDRYGAKTMLSPRFEKAGEMQRIRPVYRASGTLGSKAIEKLTFTALGSVGTIPEFLPAAITQKYRLMPLDETLHNIHFPENTEKLALARRRLIFEELLLLQLGLLGKRKLGSVRKSRPIPTDYCDEFFALLPFTPTVAQKRAAVEAAADLQKEVPMNRLLQGDVGSGKTAVAAALIYTAAKNGFQSALMAPTEVLALQHYQTLTSFFGDRLSVALLTSSVTPARRRKLLAALSAGEIDVLVGTHALIQKDVSFPNLGLVITDEQHRFGVAQRASLSQKGQNPHVLVMSATPIPRTLAMMIYGDLDLSVLDELPAGRIPIRTYHVDSSYRARIFAFLKKTLDEGRQAYIVCPLVEESESDLIPATEYYDKLKETFFKDYRLGLLHGQMKPKLKDETMARFCSGEVQLLISTVVIEVGVDVPNAAVMLIENAERFGLSQLHQLRGRIGRGTFQSTCILLSDAQNDEAKARFDILCNSTDGFEIARRDLEMRGPGDFLGNRQHGLPELKVADFATDSRVLSEAQKTAKALTDTDPTLSLPENAALKKEVARLFAETAPN